MNENKSRPSPLERAREPAVLSDPSLTNNGAIAEHFPAKMFFNAAAGHVQRERLRRTRDTIDHDIDAGAEGASEEM
jgi:hypothetical protein